MEGTAGAAGGCFAVEVSEGGVEGDVFFGCCGEGSGEEEG